MTYISINYYLFVILALFFYYIIPVDKRWIVILVGNIGFYMLFLKTGWWIFLSTIIISYFISIVLSRVNGRVKNLVLVIGLVAVILPWFFIKNCNLGLIIPVGISFYTLQIISYIVDVYKNNITVEKNLAKYMLFVSFFPQIIQGPIPRYSQLRNQLVEGHLFDENKFTKGFCYIIWGFFLKLVIADKSAVIVNDIFDNYTVYGGFYIWIASFLYSIQLYTDFLACTTLAQGVSLLFGIELIDNFDCPYFAISIKDFWRRWHISLSTWLRDYIYIPLGGNRKGKVIKYINLISTFIVSGLWHGAGIKFLIWGLLHAVYQIIGDITFNLREGIYTKFKVNIHVKMIIKQVGTFLLVNWAWIIFRANNVFNGMDILKHMFEFKKTIDSYLTDSEIFINGFAKKEVIVLFFSICVLVYVEIAHYRKLSISNKIMNLKLPIRWTAYMVAILMIMIFGTYGYGFNAQDFIYGGF